MMNDTETCLLLSLSLLSYVVVVVVVVVHQKQMHFRAAFLIEPTWRTQPAGRSFRGISQSVEIGGGIKRSSINARARPFLAAAICSEINL